MDDLLDLTNMAAALGPPPARGRPSAPLAIGHARPLTSEDMVALANPTTQVTPASPLRELRHRHHLVARLIAEGHKHVAISEIVGISQSRISVLLDDPAFQELVAHYAKEVETQYLDVHERLASLGISAIEELQDRVDDNPKALSSKELLEVSKMAFDRSVAPSKAASVSPGTAASGVSVSVNFVKAEEKGTILEGRVSVPEGQGE